MGKLVEIKTKETDSSVEDFLDAIPDEQKREDSRVLIKLMQKASQAPPKLWGTAIIGFGNTRYVSPKTGREVDWLKIGFSPRKASLSLYIMGAVSKQADTLQKLGKHKTSKGCLYINKLADVDLKVLEQIIKASL